MLNILMEDCIRQKENHAYMEHVHTCRSFPTTANAKNIDGRLDKKKRKIMHIWNRLHVFLRSIYCLAQRSTLISQAIRIFLLYT